MKALLNQIRNFLKFNILHPWVKYGKNVHIQWRTDLWSPNKMITIGNDVGIGSNCVLNTDIIIGNHVLLADSVALIARDAHSPYLVGVTMYDSPRGDKYRVVIEDDVWIGHGAIILSGVTVGRGSIIASGSIVTKDVPPYSIVAATPASIIRSRFDADQIQKHEQLLAAKKVFADHR